MRMKILRILVSDLVYDEIYLFVVLLFILIDTGYPIHSF